MTMWRIERIVAVVWVSIVVIPAETNGQLADSTNQVYVGLTVGRYSEVAEGNRYTASFARSIVVGFGRPRWLFEAEIGQTGEHCNQGRCHSNRIVNVGFVRWFGGTGPRPYLVLGCCLLHVGTGLDVPIGGMFSIAPGIDLNLVDPSAAAFRPKLAVLVRPRRR